jgi:DNA-directed RNA polymerase specialized sigma24 family protein
VTTTTFTSLIERMAAGDKTALRLLYGELSESAGDQVGRIFSRADDIRAVVNATFVEVWWLSRFHPTADTNVRAWVDGIAARRTAERHRSAPPNGYARMHDDVSRVALEGLLGKRQPARSS